MSTVLTTIRAEIDELTTAVNANTTATNDVNTAARRRMNAAAPASQGVGSIVVDARGYDRLTVITASGTATISRVDSLAASADIAPNISVASNTASVNNVDWPFYRITAVTAACRWALT